MTSLILADGVADHTDSLAYVNFRFLSVLVAVCEIEARGIEVLAETIANLGE
ncbi:MAG: hypothetical protein JOY96_08915 [Verrucomicrobia bacterium]|nr:hypothetical protein [Verrucomicrobiota bacterium]